MTSSSLSIRTHKSGASVVPGGFTVSSACNRLNSVTGKMSFHEAPLCCLHIECGYICGNASNMAMHMAEWNTHAHCTGFSDGACPGCTILCSFGVWRKGFTDFNNRDTFKCRHTNCGYYSTSRRPANQFQAVKRHERSYYMHRDSCGDGDSAQPCSVCAQLAETDKNWLKQERRWKAVGEDRMAFGLKHRLRTKAAIHLRKLFTSMSRIGGQTLTTALRRMAHKAESAWKRKPEIRTPPSPAKKRTKTEHCSTEKASSMPSLMDAMTDNSQQMLISFQCLEILTASDGESDAHSFLNCTETSVESGGDDDDDDDKDEDDDMKSSHQFVRLWPQITNSESPKRKLCVTDRGTKTSKLKRKTNTTMQRKLTWVKAMMSHTPQDEYPNAPEYINMPPPLLQHTCDNTSRRREAEDAVLNTETLMLQFYTTTDIEKALLV
jgi:hypothetical protein